MKRIVRAIQAVSPRSECPAGRRVARLLGASVLALVSGACVSQQQYDESMRATERYMRSYHDAGAHIAELEAENKRLRGELAMGVAPVEASALMGDIDRRIEDLDRLLAGMGQAPGDITVRSIEGGVAYDVRDSVLFDSGSATVRDGGRELIARLGQEIGQRPIGQIWVRGHTDADPVRHPDTLRRFPHGNLQLSASRAVEVAALLLQSSGLSEAQLGIAGLGSSHPVAANDTAANKQLNRRVEIVVLDDASPDPTQAEG